VSSEVVQRDHYRQMVELEEGRFTFAAATRGFLPSAESAARWIGGISLIMI